jgi:hypothetical protein
MSHLEEFQKIIITIADDDVEQQDYAVRQLRQELSQLILEPIEFYSQNSQIPEGAKSIDPETLNALILSIAPISFMKLLEFLHNWMMRKEGRVIKIKVQKLNGQSVEIEVPASTSQQELKMWIKTVEAAISDNQEKRK